VEIGSVHVDLIHWTAMVKRTDFTFLMKCTVRCTSSPWSPDKAGNSTCFCKQDSEQNNVIVISVQTCWCNSKYETRLRFIVNSVSVNSMVIGAIENGKDNNVIEIFPKKSDTSR
jgi:hypothetical protein